MLPIVTTDSQEAQDFVREVNAGHLYPKPARATRREVRNPVLALPAAKRLLAASPEVRGIVADIMGDLALDARARGEKCWRTHKAPMAVYWKAISVIAGHIRRVAKMGAGQ